MQDRESWYPQQPAHPVRSKTLGAPARKVTDDEDTQVLDYVESMEEDKTEEYDDDFESM